jgi:hypothetical protein
VGPRLATTAGVSALGVAALLTALVLALPLTSVAEPTGTPASVAGTPAPPPIQAPTSVTAPGTSNTPHPTTPDPVVTTAESGDFTPGPYDVSTQIKQAAVRFVETVGTWRSSDPADAVARITAAGYAADLVAPAGPLLDAAAREATTTVVYPQYGGLTGTSASVMVLARQELHTESGARDREVLVDVRMRRAADGTWQVTSAVDPARPQIAPARPGGPTALGRAVLGNPRIRFPGPARADISERRVDDPILSVIAQLADRYTLDVQVLVSGHPGTVFPTSRMSNHAVGRAVDLRAIDGRRISDIPRDDPLLIEFMIAAGGVGATEVGGPITPERKGFFSDAVHQDHFHLGINPAKPPAAPATSTTR